MPQHSLWHILTQHPTINTGLCQTSACAHSAHCARDAMPFKQPGTWGARLWTRWCSPTEVPECGCGPFSPTSAMNRSAVRIKIQGSSSKRQYLCISAHFYLFFFHGLARPSLRDFSSREMSRNNLRKIIAVASAGLSGSVNYRRHYHIHSASSFFFSTVHNNLHAAALCVFFFPLGYNSILAYGSS